MPKKGKRAPKGKKVTLDSDEEDTSRYSRKEAPDPEANEYYHDEIDDFHAARDKVPIDDEDEAEQWAESEEEEVLGLDSEDSDDDDIRMIKSQLRRLKRVRQKEATGSDVEEEEDEGLPDSKAWGSKRKSYYMEEDVDSSDLEEDEGEAALEEQEALALQRKFAEQLDDQDFGLEVFKPVVTTDSSAEKEEKIVKDLSRLSKREKLQLLKKESPELLTLIDDFKTKLSEVQTTFQPLRTLIQEKNFTGKAAEYVHTKFKLNVNYCINITFYLMLKAKHVPVHDHPVIQRLVQYRNLMKQLEPVDNQLKDEIKEILRKLQKGEEVSLAEQTTAPRTFVRRKKSVKFQIPEKAEKHKKLSEMVSDSEENSDDQYEDILTEKPTKLKKKDAKTSGRYETKEEREALEYYSMMKGRRKENEVEEEADEEEDEDMDVVEGEEETEENEAKRAISYQIQKNKGLTVHKKKELRNPRVKHRMKYRKAKIRRKGQIREPRKELTKYSGELSGIRAGVKRGIKMK